MSNESPKPVKARPASTVVPLREGEGGLEVLLVQRGKRDGTRGIWVFPGGKIEDDDWHPDHEREDLLRAARIAGARETHEEAGLALAAERLGLISRWITPPISPRRFDTWFFATTVEAHAEVRIDQAEIVDHRWLRAGDALDAQRAGEIGLAPPTFVTLCWLLEYARADEAIAGLVRDHVVTIEPRICPIEGGACILYPGDAGYADGEVDRAGDRDRLYSLADGLRYERSRG